MTLVDQLGRRLATEPVCDDPFEGERICRACGCTAARACPGGCSWVLLDVNLPAGICSACAPKLKWRADLLGAFIHPDIAAVLGLDPGETEG